MSEITFVLPLFGGDRPEGFSELLCFNSERRGQCAGLQNTATLSSPQFLNMTLLLRLLYSLLSNSTLLVYSRIHLDSEDLSFVLMWYFSLDPIGVNVVAL